MSRRLFKKFLPKRAALDGEKSGFLRRVLGNQNAWHLNRHSVARGMAVGLWWAWIPIPMQSPFACFVTWKLRGNVPLAFACCWISNPITMLPAIYICYHIGLFVTFQEPTGFLQQIKEVITHTGQEGFVAGFKQFWLFVWNNIGVVWPFFVGCFVFSTLNAIVAYFGVHALWRWNLVRRWTRRGHLVHCRKCHKPLPSAHEQSCPYCAAPSPHRTRIGLGIAALARLKRS